ncbi:T9SS C-terminal target domain-containing protein [Chryseobacterium phosphatilyticum]|uniref:T9SS C-terminal target domain-containing protein n=1 Tax=Chryseobacterium phosphatilyticum TaxID=475075 RepID=A0A316XB71_9FLAO|nr:T9SS type A sorting domain-containing protein [Chryseobacterium phosphatilyticum]PWN68668.1 T9SS C-terminal target domain-containing protein [Chryseobacterium phosphatilyticum]
MKKLYVLAGFLVSATFYSQSLMGGVNSGGVSNNNLMYTVGEIYVIPDDPDQQNSGTLGLLYQTVLDVLGVSEVVVSRDKVSVYPNPTADYVTLKISSKEKPKEASVYDLSGKLVLHCKISNDRIDLSSLLKGVYLLTFKNSELKPIKIIKK